MKVYSWNEEKNRQLKAERGVSFEAVVFYIERGCLLDVVEYHDQERYGGQRIFVVNVDDYACLVPFVETESGFFLMTIIPSRKATKKHLRSSENEQD